MTTNHHTEIARAGEVAPIAPGDQDYLRLWYSLAKRPWRSLVLVPSHQGGSAGEAARKLAEVGQKVSGLPVRVITMNALDYGTAQALADLQDQLRRLHEEQSAPAQAIEVYPAGQAGDRADQGGQEIRGPNWAFVQPPVESPHDSRPADDQDGENPPAEPTMQPMPASRFVIGVPFLLDEPLGLSATQAADAVLVLVEMGKTRMADLKAIVEQVGRDRMAGCILVE